jgi:hypothetical protein
MVDAARARAGAGRPPAAGAFEGDPIADGLVDSFKAMPGDAGWRMLDEALLYGAEGTRATLRLRMVHALRRSRVGT